MKISSMLILFILITAGLSQDSHKLETSWEVSELWEFHDVIRQMWHDAWPEKDTAMLKSLLPEIEAGYTKLSAAELPGILRDKAVKWKTGIEDMGRIIETYKNAAEQDEQQPLLNAAEALHAKFEELVRLIRPVSKEVDNFHQELYRLYHYYVPDYNYGKIKTSAASLEDLAKNLNNTKLPDHLKDRSEAFSKAVKNLQDKVSALVSTVSEGDEKTKIENAVENMHTAYQGLEMVFD